MAKPLFKNVLRIAQVFIGGIEIFKIVQKSLAEAEEEEPISSNKLEVKHFIRCKSISLELSPCCASQVQQCPK